LLLVYRVNEVKITPTKKFYDMEYFITKKTIIPTVSPSKHNLIDYGKEQQL